MKIRTAFTPPAGASAEVAALATVRRLLLLVLLGSMLALLLELALLEHYESTTQWIPLAALGAALPSLLAALLRPSRPTLLALRAVLLALIAVSLAGMYLHFRGNLEFELEMEPGLRGRALVWSSLTGATPSLAPGTLILLGLVGLIATYDHPALRRSAPPVR